MGLPVATKISSHVASALLAGAFATAFRRHYAAWEGDLSGITPDELVIAVALPAMIFAAIFGLGHNFLRHITLNARYTYSLLGAAALTCAVAIIMPPSLYSAAVNGGMISVYLSLTIGFGSLIGFLHVRSAGREVDENEIQQFEAATGASTFDLGAPDLPPARAAEATDFVQTQSADFYGGPLQVVSSWSAAVSATLAGALAHSLYAAFFFTGFGGGFDGDNDRLVEQFWSGELLQSMAFSLVFSVLICLFFVTPAVYGLHKLLSSRGWKKMSTYVIAGAVAPVATGLGMLLVGIFFTHWFILPLAVAMGVYHHLAGMEPEKLPDDIEVRDPRTLVSGNHARRRMRRIAG